MTLDYSARLCFADSGVLASNVPTSLWPAVRDCLDYYDPAPDDSSIYDPTVVVLKYLVEGTNVHALICIVDAFVNLSFNARSYEDSWYQEEAV